VAASTDGHRRRTLAEQVDRVVGYFRHAEPQPALSRSAFRADIAIAAAATIAALVTAIQGYLLVNHGNVAATPTPSGSPGTPPQPPPPGHLLPVLHTAPPIPVWALVFVVLTTAPLAFRRKYPTGAFCVILVAIIITSGYLTVVTVGSAIFAAYCAVVYSRYRRLALLALAGGAITLAAAYPQVTPEVPERYTALLDLDQYVYAALAAGASGFLLKDVSPEHLVAAVRLVQTGDALLAPSITRRLVERFAPRGPAPAGTLDTSSLTPRELEVLGLIARGLSNHELAAALTLSEATVKTHVARILTKLNLRDRVQAVVLAYEAGLVTPGAGLRES
jgi:DNA-binding NarL/FixJ family response regulator